MECNESQPFVSALYDGKHIPADAADHINGCAECRQQLSDYAEMGAELKLAASRAEEILPGPEWLRPSSPRPRLLNARSLTTRVMVPRFALGLGIIAILALSVGLTLVRAQTRARWFEFQLYPADSSWNLKSMRPDVVQAGYRQPKGWFWHDHNVAAMVSVREIQRGRVRLAIVARSYGNYHDHDEVERDLGKLRGHEYVYVPGETLEIPIEGGGKLVLIGEVFNQSPKLAWGFPIEPGPDQMVLTHPVLIRDEKDVLISPSGTNRMIMKDHELIPPSGATTMITKDHAIFIYIPGEGYFTFALQRFNGASVGEASWGELRFKLDGHDYFLLSGSPITGGDQPHAVWVSQNPNYALSKNFDRAFISSGALPGDHH